MDCIDVVSPGLGRVVMGGGGVGWGGGWGVAGGGGGGGWGGCPVEAGSGPFISGT